MFARCAVCGALLPDRKTCQEIHDALLIFEMDNAIPHRVHFLMVTCFLIQHERYSDEGLIWARSMLRDHLDETIPDRQLLYQLTRGQKGKARTWKFERTADAPPLPKIAWNMTIVDVAQRAQDVASYCKQVKQWAHLTLRQL